jgi:hypothetical protein
MVFLLFFAGVLVDLFSIRRAGWVSCNARAVPPAHAGLVEFSRPLANTKKSSASMWT